MHRISELFKKILKNIEEVQTQRAERLVKNYQYGLRR